MRLLLVEDKDSFRRLLVQALGSSWEVTALGDPAAALAALEAAPFELLVTDLRLPGMSGLELLKAAKRRQPSLRAVVMSAFGEPRDIVEAMRWGADDFLPKPFDLDQFAAVLERLRGLAEAPPPDPREAWIVHAPAMLDLDRGLARAAESGVAVLFLGEPGTGKARAARRLHTLRHPHAPFLCLSAPSLPAEGPGRRRLALLQGGSIYLSDLDELAPGAGPTLAQVLDSPLGQGIRWLGGCRDLASLPEPLRLRLGVVSFQLPPLRARREDILPLFRSFLEGLARRDGRAVPLLGRGAERELLQADWPGNLAQLAWTTAAAWRATTGAVLAPLPLEGPEPARPVAGMRDRRRPDGGELMVLPWPAPDTLAEMLAAVDRTAIGMLLRKALAGRRHQPAQVARDLGLYPRRFAQVLREHHISLEDEDHG